MALRGAFSLRGLRVLILLALIGGMGVFTLTMLALVENLSDRFGPQVRSDLEWRALRGATELARSADLGIAMDDQATVLQAFSAHTDSADVMAVVAVDPTGRVVAQHGDFAPVPLLFASRPGTILDGPGYLTSWAPVQIEGADIGKVAVVVSTARLLETRSTLSSVSTTTLIAGALVIVFGIIVIMFYTRAVAIRDEQLHDHAANLERRVEDRTRELDERNRGMRVVLDNVAQGFITMDPRGVMATERSAIVDTWFGTSVAGDTFATMLRSHAPDVASSIDMNLDMIRDGMLPLELCLDQMPRSFTAVGRSFSVAYSPIMDGDRLSHILVIVSDVTEQLARERAERDQRELVSVFQRVGRDRNAAEEFLEEAKALVACLQAPGDRRVHERALHTLKGNCGLFGFERFAAACHAIEDELREPGSEGLTADHRARLATEWAHVERTIKTLLGPDAKNVIEIERDELDAAVALARSNAPNSDVAARLESWALEPVVRRFERFAEQAATLAQRLGKGEIDIAISGEARLDAKTWGPLWAAMIHAVRNAVDHGIESPEERRLAGKGRARLELSAVQRGRELVLSIADDGPGIDWQALRARASRLGLPSHSRRDLVAAMFADGVSTRDVATAVSGRGVGLSALQAEVLALGGEIEIVSWPGQGTKLELRFLRDRTAPLPVSASSSEPRSAVQG